MARKKIDQLYADLMRYVDAIEGAIDEKAASAIGFTVRQRMLMFISRGISPILGKDRYKEYLAVTRGRNRKQLRRELNQELKFNARQTRGVRAEHKRNRTYVTKSRLETLRDERRGLRRSKQKVSGKPTGYPYSVQGKYPGKKPRPVNLYLSGDFLNALTFQMKRVGKKMKLTIGWFDAAQAIKEKGHREGAGGQPKRPTLPVGDEKFNQTIQLDIMKLLRDAVTKAAKSARRG